METKQDRFTKIKSRVSEIIVLDGIDHTLTDRSIAYCIGYGAAKCLNDEYVVKFIQEVADAVGLGNPDAVNDYIVEKECD